MSEKKTETNDENFLHYLRQNTHGTLLILLPVAMVLVPLFGLLDYYITPEYLINKFWAYRVAVTGILIVQYLVLRNMPFGKKTIVHGYFFAILISGMIVIMTADLGGFNSSYYAGVNLIMIAVTSIPWRAVHSGANGLIAIMLYVIINAIGGKDFHSTILINNLYFLMSTAVIVIAIAYIKSNLIETEYFLRAVLQETKDALWGEMEIAKKIQTALLPDNRTIGPFEISATMIPADEVGGDYYDIIETSNKNNIWLTVGDVSGHGVESGLIMMMTQTSIASMVLKNEKSDPASIIADANKVIKENIRRLKVSRYMTISALKMSKTRLEFAGKHQDILIHRAATGKVEVLETHGTWIGLTDDIRHGLSNHEAKLRKGDTILLFTDGATEAFKKGHEMYGQERLEETFKKNAKRKPAQIVESIVNEIVEFQHMQYDDITVVVCRIIG